MKQLKFPSFKKTRSLTVHVDAELLERVRAIVSDRKITLRQAVEFSLQLFIEAHEASKK